MLYSQIPYLLISGDRILIYNTAKTLSRNYEVDLVCVNEERIESEYVDGLNRKNGFLIEPYDIQGFINAIITILEDDRRREKIGRDAQKYTLENYSCEKIAGKYYQEFKKVIKKIQN